MPITVTCDCGKSYRLSDDKAGQRFKCRDCGSLVRVPDAHEDATDEGTDDDDLEMEPDAEYVPTHRRPGADGRSAKKSARAKKQSATRNRWWLTTGGVVAVLAMNIFGIAWANAVLRPEQKSLLILAGTPAYLVLGDRLCRLLIRWGMARNDETVQSIAWRPFMNVLRINGGWRPSLFYYEIRYLDKLGKPRSTETAMFARHRERD